MSDHERLRRDDPVRTGPMRNWSGLYRRSDSWGPSTPPEHPTPGAATDGGGCCDVVSHGVELGYRVVEEQIRQGQRIAQQLNNRSYDSSAMSGDLREVGERAWRYLADLGALYIDFLAGLAGDRELMQRLYGAWQPPHGPSTDASQNGSLAVSVEVLCVCATHVVLDLRPHSEAMALVCQELRALDVGPPPLTDVGFERAADGRLSLRIRVPDAQPPGTYIGTVIDSGTVQPRGTLSVRVG